MQGEIVRAEEGENYYIQNNESVKELRENRYRLQQKKLKKLKKDIRDASE